MKNENKYSNCCGVAVSKSDHLENGGRCPECKEHCELENDESCD